MNERIAALGARERAARPDFDNTVHVRHVDPEPRRRGREKAPQYPGWRPSERVCRREDCADTFLPEHPAQAYCTAECQRLVDRGKRRVSEAVYREKKRRERRAGPSIRVCALEGCGVEFEPDQPRTRYHSEECKREAQREQKRASAKRKTRPAPITEEAIAEIKALERRCRDSGLNAMQTEYLVLLWKQVNEDPACPSHVYERLERLLGLTGETSTMPTADAA